MKNKLTLFGVVFGAMCILNPLTASAQIDELPSATEALEMAAEAPSAELDASQGVIAVIANDVAADIADLQAILPSYFTVRDYNPKTQQALIEHPEYLDTLEALALLLDFSSIVVYAEPNYILETSNYVPNDPFFETHQWNYYNTVGSPLEVYQQYEDVDTDMLEAWEVQDPDGAEVIIALIDYGVDYTHPDLAANMWDGSAGCKNAFGDVIPNGCPNHGYDYVDFDNDPIEEAVGTTPGINTIHGTPAAGLMTSEHGNGIGVAGPSRYNKLKMMALRRLSNYSIIQGINFATENGAQVIAAEYYNPTGGYSALQEQAIDNFPGVFVAAAGNNGKSNDVVPSYPCNYDLENVICVGATYYNNDQLIFYSNYGTESVDIAAPTSVYTTGYDNTYRYFTGTSASIPQVTAAAGLVYSNHPSYDAPDVINTLLNSADQIESLEGKIDGARRLNVARALGADPDGDGNTGGGPDPIEDEEEEDVVCFDWDGDGWGWDGEKGCFVADFEDSITELSVQASSDDPDNTTFELSTTEASDWYTTFIFELDSGSSTGDVLIESLDVDFDIDNAAGNYLSSANVFEDVQLIIEGTIYENYSLNGSWSKFEFNPYFTLEPGENVEAEFQIMFKALDTEFSSSTVQPFINSIYIDAEDESGDEIDAEGKIYGSTHTLIAATSEEDDENEEDVVCFDWDGDGWGWDGEKGCLVADFEDDEENETGTTTDETGTSTEEENGGGSGGGGGGGDVVTDEPIITLSVDFIDSPISNPAVRFSRTNCSGNSLTIDFVFAGDTEETTACYQQNFANGTFQTTTTFNVTLVDGDDPLTELNSDDYEMEVTGTNCDATGTYTVAQGINGADATDASCEFTFTFIGEIEEEEEDVVCFDWDGDGWGWDGEKGCQVADFEDDEEETEEQQEEEEQEEEPLECPADSDHDGDGWGWDGEKGCLVETT